MFGGSVVAALIGGMVALLAPCCASVMVPAYLATSAHNRRALVAMTFVFAAGIATVITPLALGATALRRAIFGHHLAVYTVGGVLLIGLGFYVLAGGRMRLPAPGHGTDRATGPFAVYSLGLFSGVATSCCAPVLAGVVALSGAANSFVVSLVLAGAYVTGMVAPLFVIALLWERYDWRTSRVFRPRSVEWHIGGWRRTTSVTGIVSGVLLIVMGTVTVAVGVTGPAMGNDGWQARLSARISHYGADVRQWFEWLPGWAAILGVVSALLLLARRASRARGDDDQLPDEFVAAKAMEETR